MTEQKTWGAVGRSLVQKLKGNGTDLSSIRQLAYV